MVELKTYSEELFNRILYATESNSTFSEEEFFNLTSELLGEAGVLDDIEYHPFKNREKVYEWMVFPITSLKDL